MSTNSGYMILGVDEAGRGAWAGPVCAGAFLFISKTKPAFSKKFADSKQLSEIFRENLFEEMHTWASLKSYLSGVAMSDANCIDSVGIREANRLAMQGAILQVLEKLSDDARVIIEIDGRDNYTFDFGKYAKKVEEIHFIVRGDSKVKEIMGASILAKVSRDRYMRELAKIEQNYGFEKHKWYGTAVHQDVLKRLWVSPSHRRSYAPIREILGLECVKRKTPRKKILAKTKKKAGE